MSRLCKLVLDGVIGMCFLTGVVYWIGVIVPWIHKLLNTAT